MTYASCNRADLGLQWDWTWNFSTLHKVRTLAKLSLQTISPAIQRLVFAERNIVAGASRDLDDKLIEFFDRLGLAGEPGARGLTLSAVLVVLTTLEHAAARGQKECVVRPASQLLYSEIKSEQRGHTNALFTLVEAQLAKSVIAPSVHTKAILSG